LNQQRLDLQKANAALKNFKDSLPKTPATVSAKPRMVKILPRGNWMDESGEVVLPATPHFLTGHIESTAENRLTRLDLAKWIVNKENPLTARTFVNRLWAQFFGEGLSINLDDLGSQGEWPKYNELLDWLALEFMDSSWDVKHLVKTIMMSKTYQQSSLTTPALLKEDPQNRLLARQSQFRIDAEFVRDAALSISGLINLESGGGLAKPYQPDGYYQHLNFPRRTYQEDKDSNQYRRGVYMHWQRTFLHPMLKAFDAPVRDECNMKRARSNTPIQALVLLNDPTFVESARVFAQTILKQSDDINQQLRYAFRNCLGREPTSQEITVLKDLHQAEFETYAQAPEKAQAFISIGIAPVPNELNAASLAAMTSVTRALLNAHETITRY